MHVDKSPKNPKFPTYNTDVRDAFKNELMLDYTYYYEKMMSLNIPVLIYAGEFDNRAAPNTMEEFLKGIPSLKTSDLWNQARQVYYIKDSQGKFVTGGYFR